jgi:dynein heavy chain
MSPLGEAFRERLRKFPSIVNCTTIDWFSAWPDEALQSVAMRSFVESDLDLGSHLESVVTVCKGVHQSVFSTSIEFRETLQRHNYVTPTSYLELLSTYRKVLGKKRTQVGSLKDRLQNGLDKLMSTAEVVGKLQADIVALKPVLVKTVAEVEAMIVNIDKDKAAAAVTQAEVEVTAAAAEEKATATKAIADDAQRDLDEALPALEEAVQCLKKLNKADIDEVRQFKIASPGVLMTCKAICILFQVKPSKIKDDSGKKVDDWFGSAKKELLSKGANLIDDMKEFDKDHIPEKVIASLKPLIEDPGFTPEAVKKASVACMAMCMWARAMDTYNRVVLVVEPKKALLAEAQAELDGEK